MRNNLPKALLAAFWLCACTTGRNYLQPDGPRYRGGVPIATQPERLRGDTFCVVSFNIQNGVHIDSALAVFESTSELRDPDVVMLQEVDQAGTERIARALRMAYVYYPAEFRNNIKRDWGNAVLSRWPIVQDRKIVLPHIGFLAKTMRAATAATIMVGAMPLRLYSTHLGTVYNVLASGRRDQLRAILNDADAYDFVIIAGDMNSSSVGVVARQAGYFWPTQTIPKTNVSGRLDHVFTKGLFVPETHAAGTVADNHHASDHKPVWARLLLK